MKIKRDYLERIVREELARYIQNQLREAPQRPPPPLEDPTSSQDEEVPLDPEAIPDPENAPEEQLPSADGAEAGDMDLGDMPPITGELPPEGQEGEEMPGDMDGEEEDLEDVAGGGEIADEIQGKMIDSIRMEPKSKIIPGAQEIVLKFNDIPDALHILLTKTGQFKFFFRGLHNDLGDQQGEEDLEDTGEEDLEGMLGAEDLPDQNIGTEVGPSDEMPPEGDEEIEIGGPLGDDFGRESGGEEEELPDTGPTLGKKRK